MTNLCRVYQSPDGTVRIVHPNARARLGDETDAEFYVRVFAHAEASDPSLARLPRADLSVSGLPPFAETCRECGDVHPVRDQWRLTRGRVVVDRAAPNPQAAYAHALKALEEAEEQEQPDASELVLRQLAVKKAAASTRGGRRA